MGSGFFKRVKITKRRDPITDEEGAAGLLAGEGVKAVAAVLDCAADLRVAVGGPVDLGEEDAVGMRTLGVGLVDQDLRVGDLAGADGEDPGIAGSIAHTGGRIEDEADAVEQLDGIGGVQEVGDGPKTVPEAEEDGIDSRREGAEGGGIVEGEVAVTVKMGGGAVDDLPVAEAGVAIEGFEIEVGQAGVEDGGPVRQDLDAMGGTGLERAEADETAVEPRPEKLRAAGVDVGDLDAVEVVLEAGVAAAGHNRAIAGDDGRRLQGNAEPAEAGRVVGEAGQGGLTVLAVGEAEESEAEAGVNPLRGIGAAEGRLDQSGGVLKAVQLLQNHLQNDGVADAVADVGRGGAGRVEGRFEIRSDPIDGRLRVGWIAGKDDEQAVGPEVTWLDGEMDLVADDSRRDHLEAAGLTDWHRGHTAADHVATGLVSPVQSDPLRGGQVGIEGDAALLEEEPLIVVGGPESPGREVALHGCVPFLR